MSGPSRFLDTHKVVIGANAAAIDAGWLNSTYSDGEYIHVGKYNHLTIIVVGGAAAGAYAAFTVKQATSAAGGSAKNVTVTENFKCTTTSAGSDTWVATTVTSNTWTPTTTTAGLHYIIEIDSRDLDLANDFEWVAINLAAGGNAGNFMACVYILSEGRYQIVESSPTCIA